MSSSMWDGMFTAFRGKPGPTLYASIRTPVTEDPTFWASITLIIILVTSYLLTVLGLPRNERFKSLFRFLMGAAVTSSILFSIFGQEWFSSSVSTRTRYTAHSDMDINATIGIKVGLKQVNITLQGNPEKLQGETINYNEKFAMDNFKTLGRDFKKARKHGTPTAILWVAEYLAMDAGGVRYGRYYRIAGHYAYIALWSAFACWMVTCVVYKINVHRAAEFTILTGILILTGVISHVILSPETLKIKFRDAWLYVERGWCFWLSLITGVVMLIGGILLIILDRYIPVKTAEFFSIQHDVDEGRTTSTPSIFKSRHSVTPLSIDSNSASIQKKQSRGETELFVVHESKSTDVRKRSGSAHSQRNGGTLASVQNGGYNGPQADDVIEEFDTSTETGLSEPGEEDLDNDQDALEQEILGLQETTVM